MPGSWSGAAAPQPEFARPKGLDVHAMNELALGSRFRSRPVRPTVESTREEPLVRSLVRGVNGPVGLRRAGAARSRACRPRQVRVAGHGAGSGALARSIRRIRQPWREENSGQVGRGRAVPGPTPVPAVHAVHVVHAANERLHGTAFPRRPVRWVFKTTQDDGPVRSLVRAVTHPATLRRERGVRSPGRSPSAAADSGRSAGRSGSARRGRTDVRAPR